MKILLTCCTALLIGASSLSAYYYQGGYYNHGATDGYHYPATLGWGSENESNYEYQDIWYQGSLNPFSFLMAYGSSTYTTYPTLPNSDNAVAEKVRYKLASTSGLTGGGNIDVSVQYGRVTLSGSVSSNTEKTMAGSAARSVPGVTGVINHLIISK